MKKWIAMGTFAAMVAANSLGAHPNEEYYYADTGGCGYEECCRASCLAPAVALGTIALVAIIAVAVQNSNSGGSDHAHCDCN